MGVGGLHECAARRECAMARAQPTKCNRAIRESRKESKPHLFAFSIELTERNKDIHLDVHFGAHPNMQSCASCDFSVLGKAMLKNYAAILGGGFISDLRQVEGRIFGHPHRPAVKKDPRGGDGRRWPRWLASGRTGSITFAPFNCARRPAAPGPIMP